MNTKKLYRQLLTSVLLRENVVEVVCTADEAHYFDKLVVNQDGSIKVYYEGLEQPLSHIFLELDLRYAKLLYYIEEDLRAVKRGGVSKHGLSFKFKSETELGTRVLNILLSNGLSFPISIIKNSFVEIDVMDGDWKQEHLSLQHIMEKNGFILMGKRVTDEDGYGRYSAVYTYKNIGVEKTIE